MERERPVRRNERPTPEAPPATPRGQAGGEVRVHWGAMSESLERGGLSVGDARELLTRPYHIPAEAQVTVNGVEAEAGQRLEAGDVLEFVRLAGEKGAG